MTNTTNHTKMTTTLVSAGGGGPNTLVSEAQQAYDQFWPKVNEEIRQMGTNGLKALDLPLARIKKIMKLDEVGLAIKVLINFS